MAENPPLRLSVVSVERVKYWKEATNPMAIALEASDNEMVLVVTYRISSPTSEGDWYGLKLADVSGHVYESTNVGGNFTAIKEKLSEPYTFTGSVGFEIPSNTDIRTFSIGDTAFDIQEMFSRSASQKN